MYFLSVKKNGEWILDRMPFPDCEAALAHTARFYRPRTGRSVLSFTTEVVNGVLIVSYAILRRVNDIDANEQFYREKYEAAVRNESAFEYDASYVFSIQSEAGILEADACDRSWE